MNKNTEITKVAVVGKNNEIVGYEGTKRVDGWPAHNKATKTEIKNFIKWCEEFINNEEDTFTLEKFGEEFDTWQEEMDESHGLEEEDEEEEVEGDEEEKVGMHINADYKAKYAQFNQSCGDDLANAMHDTITIQVPKHNKEGKKIGTKDACDMASMKKVAKANGLGTRMDAWMHLNIGHIRMILRNSLYAMIQHGHKVVVGNKTWKENKKLQAEMADKKKKQAKKFADLKKKSKNSKEKKDNKVKKNNKKKAA